MRTLGLLLALATGIWCCVRAATQSITWDEGTTYVLYVSQGWGNLLWLYDANHHVLFTVLARLSCLVFGHHELALRAPTLVAAFVFLLLARRLCARLFGDGWLGLLVFAALALNPFTLDYLSLARGYGLALTFQLAALHAAVSFVSNGSLRHLAWLSAWSALAVLSNLTWVLPSLALALMTVVLGWRAHAPLAMLWRLVLPGAAVLVLLGAPLVHARRGHFYTGTTTLVESLQSVLAGALAHGTWPLDARGDATDVARRLQLAAGAALAWLGAVLVLVVAKARSRERLDRELVLVGGALLLACAGIALLHWVLDAPWPIDRTGAHLAPVCVLALGLAVATLRRGSPRARGAAGLGMLVLLVLLGRFVMQLPDRAFHPWRMSADSRAIFERMDAHARARGGSLQVAVHSDHLSAFLFHWHSRSAPWVGDYACHFAPDRRFDLYVVPARLCRTVGDGLVEAAWPVDERGKRSMPVRMRPLEFFGASGAVLCVGAEPR